VNRKERAKQFAPFDALKGLKEALAEKEYENEKLQRRELSEEEFEEIQSAILKLQKGDIIEVTCFENGYYITVKGALVKKDLIFRYLIVGDGRIAFEDIYRIKIL
jgi:hypothetical protein